MPLTLINGLLRQRRATPQRLLTCEEARTADAQPPEVPLPASYVETPVEQQGHG
jgi:hypothetical protein